MKVCLIADAHLKAKDRLGVVQAGINTRIEQKQILYKTVIVAAHRHGCSHIIELGDTFDKLNPPDSLRFRYAKIVQEAIIGYGLSWIRVIGNHETTGETSSVVGLDSSMLSLGKYNVVDVPTVCTIGATKVLLVPEVGNVGKVLDAMLPSADIVFGHFPVVGAMYANGRCESYGVSRLLFKEANKFAFLGHIHRRQILGKVQYIGCMARCDFGDKDVATGCCIVEMNAGSTRVSYTYEDHTDITLCELVYREKENAKLCVPKNFSVVNAVVKIILSGSKSWVMSFPITVIREALLAKGAIKVFVEYDIVGKPQDKSVLDAGSINVDVLRSIKETKDKYVRRVGIDYYNKAMSK